MAGAGGAGLVSGGGRRLGAMRGLLVGGMVTIGALGMAGCAGDDSGGGPSPQVVTLTLGDGGCEPADLRLSAGRIEFHVSNPRSSSVTNVEVRSGAHVVGSVTNVLGGLTRYVTIELAEGSYTLHCASGSLGGDGRITVER